MLFEATFKALADPTRRRILELLRHGEMSAGELCARFDATGATISHHLSVLKAAGLVSDEKRGKYIYYSLDTSVVEDIFTWLAGLCAPGGGAAQGNAPQKPPSAPARGQAAGAAGRGQSNRAGKWAARAPKGKVKNSRKTAWRRHFWAPANTVQGKLRAN